MKKLLMLDYVRLCARLGNGKGMTPFFASVSGSAFAELSGEQKVICRACVGSLPVFWRFADYLIKRPGVSNYWVVRLVNSGVVSNRDASKLKRVCWVNDSANTLVNVFPVETYPELSALTHLTKCLRTEKRNASN